MKRKSGKRIMAELEQGIAAGEVDPANVVRLARSKITRPMGRPMLAEEARASKIVTFRLTPGDYTRFVKVARAAGSPGVSSYLQDLVKKRIRRSR
jgi:ketopantoate reductase